MRGLLLTVASLAAAGAAVAEPAAPGAAEPPGAPVRIYIAPDDHTDFMWTAPAAEYERAYLTMLDYYLNEADRTEGEPSAYRTKWHADGSHWFWVFERNRSSADMARLMGRVRDQSFSLPLNTAVSTYGGAPMEAVLRNMYYAGNLERRFDVRIPLAIAMEAQTLPYGLGALWAGSGARYSWKGVCSCLTKIDSGGRRPHEIYWWKGDDGSRLLMKWQTNLGGDRVIGSYAEAREPERQIELVGTDERFRKHYPYEVVGIFGHGWDDLTTTTDLFPKLARSMSRPGRQVIASNMIDFFRDFEATHGSELPELSASFGNEWDLYPASVQGLASRVRRSVEKLRSAEAMASVVSMERPDFMRHRRSERDRAWVNLGLFWEHDWTADSPYVSKRERTVWARRLVEEIEAYVDALHRDGVEALSELITARAGRKRFFVFNPLGWTRSDAADMPFAEAGDVHVVDLVTGREVASQVEEKAGEGGAASIRMLRIWAEDLPSVGYKVFEIRPGRGSRFPAAATATLGTQDPSPWKLKSTRVDTPYYTLHVAGRGALLSLVDKTRGNRELLRHGFDARTNDLGIDLDGETVVESSGPVSMTLRSASDSPLSHTSRVTLFRRSPRIDLHNEITENFDGTHSWSFSFELKNPVVRHEEIGVIATARLKEEGGHYSSTMSNLEWLTLNHFADMAGHDGSGVTLSNADLAFMKLGKSATAQKKTFLDTRTPQIRVLAGGQIDGPQAGIPKQGGDRRFLNRFALQPHSGYDPVRAMRMALEHQNPPVAAPLAEGKELPERAYSLLSNSNPQVLLWTLKPAEDEPASGVVARVWNVGTAPQAYRLNLRGGIRQANRATHVETPIEELKRDRGGVALEAQATQVQTVILRPAATPR